MLDKSIFMLEFAGNAVWRWVLFLFLSLFFVTLFFIFAKFFSKKISDSLYKSNISLMEIPAKVLARTRPLLIAPMALYVCSYLLEINKKTEYIFHKTLRLLIFIQVLLWAYQIIVELLERFLMSKSNGAPEETAVLRSILRFVVQVVVVLTAGLVLLDNLGVNVKTLIAGLGVGGVAVALAVQNILGDLFASLSIALDKPFQTGDFIVVDQTQGHVERVGLKTTRIRSITGEQIVVSNTDLLKSRIQNFKRMSERRAVLRFGLSYAVPSQKIPQVIQAVAQVIRSEPLVRFERAHFKGFGESSLDCEAVYFVLTPDYAVFMDIQQRVNLGVMGILSHYDADFAFPTRILRVEAAAALGAQASVHT